MYRKAHIPGSKNLPVGTEDFEKEVEEMAGGKDKEVVVYCADQECDASPKAARKLEEAGFQNVSDYEGGTDDWKQAGLELAGAVARH